MSKLSKNSEPPRADVKRPLAYARQKKSYDSAPADASGNPPPPGPPVPEAASGPVSVPRG